MNMDLNEREQLAKRAHLDGKTFYDEFGHGLDEIGLGSILVVTVLVSSVIPFGSFQDTTPVLAFYLLIFGIVAWLFIRWVGRPFLYRLMGRITPQRDFAAYRAVFLVTSAITLAAQLAHDPAWLAPQVPVWGSYFTLP